MITDAQKRFADRVKGEIEDWLFRLDDLVSDDPAKRTEARDWLEAEMDREGRLYTMRLSNPRHGLCNDVCRHCGYDVEGTADSHEECAMEAAQKIGLGALASVI